MDRKDIFSGVEVMVCGIRVPERERSSTWISRVVVLVGELMLPTAVLRRL